MNTMRFKTMPVEVTNVDDDNSTLGFVFSTSDIDRQGEKIAAGSWQLDEYQKNPVVLFGHDHNQPAVGQVTRMEYAADGTLSGDIKFAAAEYDFANTLYKLYKGKFMRAVSVGFMSNDVGTDVKGDTVLNDNVLYEVSVVNVPANSAALAKGLGIDVPDNAIEKIGRVLSAKNRGTIAAARDALDEVLAADSKDEDKQAADANVSTKVEQPVTKDGRAHTVAKFNRAIRLLIKTKSEI